ncbi:MAG: hypothetical protein AB7E10_08695 [Burkholderiaceae bacterium]
MMSMLCPRARPWGGSCSFAAVTATALLAACRTLGVESEDAPQRGQFLPDLPPHSGAMGQETGVLEEQRSQKWAAAAHLQPAIPKSDRLLGIRCAHFEKMGGAHV